MSGGVLKLIVGVTYSIESGERGKKAMQVLSGQPLSSAPSTEIPTLAPPNVPPLIPRTKMRNELTRLLTASALCDADFPNIETLPRVAEIPYAHLGHQVLLNYEEFASDIWATVRLVQTRVSILRVRVAQVLSIAVVVIASIVGYILSGGGSEDSSFWPVVLVALILGGVVYSLSKPNAARACAWARVTCLKKLLKDERPGKDAFGPPIDAIWGDGKPSATQIPVVTTRSGETFPGFGRWQAAQLFVCPPDTKSESGGFSGPQLLAAVFEAAKQEVNDSDVQNVETGKVVVVHDKSLRKDSGWLDRGRPRLFLTPKEFDEFDKIDSTASARAYGMIQALLPEHLGIITFFLRTFYAGNSAAVEISLCTLGPPISSWFDVQKRIRQYEEYRRPLLLKIWNEWRDRKPPKTSLGLQLRRIRKSYQAAAREFQRPKSPLVVAKLASFDPLEKKEAEQELPKLASIGDSWPGNEIQPRDLRDWFSLSVTKDYFGNKECIATIRTLYDRLGKAVLRELENHGYSIEEYKSDQGRLILNAERIGQLVVAERISGPVTQSGLAPKTKGSKSVGKSSE
jgi:hypothetical protein